MSEFLRPVRGKSETGLLMGLSTWSVFFVWMVFGSAIAIYATSRMTGLNGEYLSVTIRFALLWLLAWFAPRVFGRSSRTLLSATGDFRWRWLAIGSGAWLAITLAMVAVEQLLSPTTFTYTFELGRLPLMVAILFVVLPLQTSAEELLFRSLVPQSLAAAIRSRLVVALLSGLLFALPHLSNPEVGEDFGWALLAYGALGAAWTAAVIRTGGIEVSIGAHLANNAFALLVVGYGNSALSSVSIWVVPASSMAIDAAKSLVGVALWLLVIHRLSGISKPRQD